ncbi:uncharacterized protein LOC123258768 [Cotesia glomerata]|uniref:uncharacterized protein LOC123258768 n=2 Tax=Cotesia glomerata TaxID=32391 RepID=UPI001D03307B|nr:uncharacterized protein LOC123258768 [Cotesia glomerata]
MSQDNNNSMRPSQPNANPTSEVGSTPSISMQEHMAILRELIQSIAQKPDTNSRKFTLPRFNPETSGSDPAAWSSAVSIMMEENPLQGSALFSALSSALEGSAAQWLTQIMVGGTITWSRFKELFISRFGGRETAASALMKIFNEQPLKDETTGAFGIRLRSLLKARWENLSMAEIINGAVLYRLTSQDHRVERTALTSEVKTEDQFLNEMRAYSYAKKRPLQSSENSSSSDPKRFKPTETRIKCLFCGISGHKISECRKKSFLDKRKNSHSPEGSRPSTAIKVTCFKCHKEGHIAPNCPSRKNNSNSGNNSGNQHSSTERRVDFCTVDVPVGTMTHMDAPEDV